MNWKHYNLIIVDRHGVTRRKRRGRVVCPLPLSLMTFITRLEKITRRSRRRIFPFIWLWQTGRISLMTTPPLHLTTSIPRLPRTLLLMLGNHLGCSFYFSNLAIRKLNLLYFYYFHYQALFELSSTRLYLSDVTVGLGEAVHIRSENQAFGKFWI